VGGLASPVTLDGYEKRCGKNCIEEVDELHINQILDFKRGTRRHFDGLQQRENGAKHDIRSR